MLFICCFKYIYIYYLDIFFVYNMGGLPKGGGAMGHVDYGKRALSLWIRRVTLTALCALNATWHHYPTTIVSTFVVSFTVAPLGPLLELLGGQEAAQMSLKIDAKMGIEKKRFCGGPSPRKYPLLVAWGG